MNKIGKKIAVIIFLLLQACDSSLTDGQYVDQAKEYLDKGEFGSAIIELKNALQKNKSNPEARHLLGALYLKVGDPVGAEKEILLASELGVAPESTHPILSKALLAQAKFEDLEALPAEKLISGVEKAEVLAAKGVGQLMLQDLDKASALLEVAERIGRYSNYVRVAKARLLHAKAEDTNAIQVLEEVLESDREYAPAWGFLGDVYRSMGEFSQAEKAYSEAIRISDVLGSSRRDRGLVRLELNQYELAKEDAESLLRKDREDVFGNYIAGSVYLHKKELQQAKSAFERSLKVNDRQFMPTYKLALVDMRLGNMQQAELNGERALSMLPSSVGVRKLLARIKINKQDYDEAEKLVRPVVEQRSDDALALDLLVEALAGQSKYKELIHYLKRQSAEEPSSVKGKTRLGAALIASGESNVGVRLIEELLKENPTLIEGYRVLYKKYIQDDEIDKASRVVTTFRASMPEHAEPLVMTGHLLLRKGEKSGAIEAFREARKIAPEDPFVSTQLADLLVVDGEYKEAREIYEGILNQQKNHFGSLTNLAILDAMENKEQEMVSHLQQAIEAAPLEVQPRVMMARYYLLKGDPGKVNSALVDLSEQAKNHPSVLEVKLHADLAQKNYRSARHYLEKLISLNPNMASLHYLMAKAYAGLRDELGVKRELNDAVRLSPRSLLPRIALTKLAMFENDSREVERQLVGLKQIAPKHPEVLKLEAARLYADGSTGKALDLLQQIFTDYPTTESLVSITRKKWALGDAEEALVLQREWLDTHPDDIVVRLLVAEELSLRGDIKSAIKQYESVLKYKEDSVLALNGLGWLLRLNQPSKALEYAQRAFQLAPESPQVMDTLAMVQLSNGQLERASRSIERALQKVPENRSTRYHSAMIAEASGDISEATKILSGLLRDPSEFPERTEAEQMLNRLKSN